MDSELDKIAVNIEQIKSLHPTVVQLSNHFREANNIADEPTEIGKVADYWRINTYGHALVKLSILIEDNFNVIESLGLVVVTRYIFELTLWLKLFELDVNYALVYKKRFLDIQKRYRESTLNQCKCELDLLNGLEIEDSEKMREVRKEIISNPTITSEESSAIILQAQNETDAKAARLFSLYTDDAKINGYGFQAFLIETKKIPEIEKDIKKYQKYLEDFDEKYSALTMGLLGCGKWDKMAQRAGMVPEYDYIYSVTSKLLHCSPMSLTTNENRLQPEEVILFTRYIHTKIRDIIELAVNQPECKLRIIKK